jgi:hypothetical protein
MALRLAPLYAFVGAIAATTNDLDEKRYYKFKSGVHSEHTIKSVQDLRSKHPFIPKKLLDRVIGHSTSPATPRVRPASAKPPEELSYDTEEDSSLKYQLIGNPPGLQVGEANMVFLDLYAFIFKNPLHGIVQSTCDDLNQTLCVKWTTSLLINSQDTCFKFANMVATRLTEANSEFGPRRQRGHSTFIISHTFLHTAAQSKLLMGAKRWFANVVHVRPLQAELDRLRAIINDANSSFDAFVNALAQLEIIQEGTLRYVGEPLLRVKTKVI